MFGNPSDKPPNPNNNTSTGLFASYPTVQQNKPTSNTPFSNPSAGLFGSSTPTPGGLFGSTTPTPGGLFGSTTPTPGGLFGSTTPTPGGLFGLTTTPTGGLFGAPTGGLFGVPSTNTMKTTQRKQGGLFGSVNTAKPPATDEAPKPLFPAQTGTSASTGLFGLTTGATVQTKDQKKATGSLLGNTTPSLISKNTTPSVPFIATPKEDEKKPVLVGGLFSGGTNETKEKPENKQKPASTFGSNSGSLFASTPTPTFGDKKQTPGLFNTSGTPAFSGLSQGSTLFGGSKKQDDKKEPQSLLSSSTPSTPLFGQKTTVENPPQQKPAFSLTGGLSNPSSSLGLFGKKSPESKPEETPKPQFAQKQDKTETKPSTGSLFNSSQPKDETTKTTAPSAFGSGGLFGTQKTETKPQEAPSGLFGNNQTTPSSTGGFFGAKTYESKSNDSSSKAGLFPGNTSLLNNQIPKNDKKQTGTINQAAVLTGQDPKSSENLLATFSKQKIPEGPTADNETGQNFQKQTNRTISFNQNLSQTNQISANPPAESKPSQSGGLFANNQSTTPVSEKKPAEKGGLGISMTESIIKPGSINQPSFPSAPVSNVSKSQKMMQESFFKPPETTKKYPPAPTIWTAHQINNLLKEEMIRKSQGQASSNGEKSQRNFAKNIQEWIEVSFKRFNQVPTTQMLQKKYQLHFNEDINRFLNDIAREVVLLVNLPLEEKLFTLVNKLFFELLDKLGIKEYLFNCTKLLIAQNQAKGLPPALQIIQLNINYFEKHQIYKYTPEGLQLNLESEELQKYLLTLTRKFITNQLQYLEYIQNKPELLKLPSQLFYGLLAYCLKYKKTRLGQSNLWRSKNGELVGLVEDFEKKMISKVVTLLGGFVESVFYDFLLINKQLLPELIQLVESFSYTEEEEIVHLSLKVILNNLGLGVSNAPGKQEVQLSAQLTSLIKQTKSLQLLPFRTLASILQNKGHRASPSAHDLYRFISGPEWLEWLQIYLGNGGGEKEISFEEAKYIIKILKYPMGARKRICREKLSPREARYVQGIDFKVLNRKKPIFKYIVSLKEENMLSSFYEILMSIVYDYDSYRKVEQLFFRQKQQFNYEFRNVIAEICNYPTQKLTEEIPFLQQKVLYFLRIVQVAPERTLALEKLVFESGQQPLRRLGKEDGLQLRDTGDASEVGHKICHLIIDTVNYFGLKNDQKTVAKCISAIKSLLQNEDTSLAMKIAMAVNKPQLLFISSSLLIPNQYRLIDSLVVDMTELLEFMLISEEFPQTVALGLCTNNSEDVRLERMYSVRYSGKDYLPFAKELIKSHVENGAMGSSYEAPKVTITYSSYWILKCLEVLVQGFRQEKTTASSYSKNLLYVLSLILEKLYIPISRPVQFQSMSTQMLEETIERVNNPIYSNPSSTEIPKVLLYLAEALNTIDIMAVLSHNLNYKLLNTGQTLDPKTMTISLKYCLTNQMLQDDYDHNQFVVYLSVKLLKQILQVYRVYQQFKHAPLKRATGSALQSAENHFVYKLLTRFKWIQDLEFHLFLKGFSKNDLLEQENNSTTNLVIALITLLTIDARNKQKSNAFIDEIFESTPLNLKEHNYRKPFVVPIESTSTLSRRSSNQLSTFSQVESFYTRFGQTLNFEAINNFLVNPTNAYLESYESLQCLVMQALGLMISGEALFGAKACNTINESSINIAKFIGFYTSLDFSSEVFSNMWILQNFENQLYGFLSSRHTSIQLKQAVLDFLYQVIKSEKSSNNFIIAKKIFYRYLVRHLDRFSQYGDDEVNRLNVIVIRILNLLEERDYFIMRKQCKDQLLDALIGAMLKSCQKCLKSTSNLLKLIKSFASKAYYPSEFAYYHLERTYEERDIVKTGQAYQILKGIIELIEKRFFDIETQSQATSHKWKCIKKVNALIIALNLPYVASVVHDSKLSQLSIRHIHQESTNRYYFNTNLPHSFGQNPSELYLNQAKTLPYIETAFDAYKQNVVDWLCFASMRLGSRIIKFLNWVLTVDRSLYGNQPVVVKSKQLQVSKQQSIICSMHMGTYNHSAVQLFADTQNQAINLVKTLYDQSLRNLEKGMTVNQTKCFSIMGYCLEWIRARQNTQDILEHLAINTLRNPFWIDQNTIKDHSVIKFILSLVSIGSGSFEVSEFKNIRGTISETIQKYKEGKCQFEQGLIQELISILISIPPQMQDAMSVSQIVGMWKNETNSEYFYNQSCLLLEMCENYPNQIAKLRPLRSCQKIKKAVSTSHYSYNLRYPDSIAFVWGLKIASTLMSSEMETVLIFEEISEFYNLKSDQIYSLLLRNTTTLTLVHIEELQALLEFILTLITSQSWVTVHRKQFQKLTYALSHKLMNTFMDFVNSKISFVAESDMEKRFKKVKFESYVDQLKEQSQNFIHESSLERNSVFRMLAELKMVECIKTFTLVLSRCFEQSWYVHKYFNAEVYENYRYGVSFWDRMNKCVMDLIRFNINIEKKWRKSENLNQKLLLIQDCINSSEFFVETGYLSSLYWIPSNAKELFQEFEELNRLSLELGTIHMIQQKTFRQKYQCLMKGNIQKFGKKLLQNSKLIQSQSQQQQIKQDKSIKSKGTLFIQSWEKNMTYLIKTI